MIEKFLGKLKKKRQARLPKHIALTYNNYNARGIKMPVSQHFRNKLSKIKDFIDVQAQYDIPIFTIFLLSSETTKDDNFPEIIDAISCFFSCLLYTSPSPRDRTRSRMPSSA